YGRDPRRECRRFGWASLLRCARQDRARARRGLSHRSERGFLSRICPGSPCQCAFAGSLRAILASPGGGPVQGLCSGVAFCGGARHAIAARASEHQRVTVKITLLDLGVSNVASVECALERLGAQSERAATPECIANAEA